MGGWGWFGLGWLSYGAEEGGEGEGNKVGSVGSWLLGG